MTDYVELEITLSRWDVGRYQVELQINDPAAETRQAAVRSQVDFNLPALEASQLKPEAYSILLKEAVFAEEEIRSYFQVARTAAQQGSKKLRLYLSIDRSALELHSLRWEMLLDPQDDTPLAIDPNVLFSRFLASQDWEPIQLRPKKRLKALAAIANPSDLAEGKFTIGDQVLPEVNVAAELERAQHGFSEARLDELVSDPAAPGTVSIANLMEKLRQGYDILYLVCHGA